MSRLGPRRPELDLGRPDEVDIPLPSPLPTDGKLLSLARHYLEQQVRRVGLRHTQRSRYRDLQLFVIFFYSAHLSGDIVRWNRATSEAFIKKLADAGYANSTITLAIDNLGFFSRFLIERGVIAIENNPLRGVKRPIEEPAPPRGLHLVSPSGKISRFHLPGPVLMSFMEAEAEARIRDHDIRRSESRWERKQPRRDFAILLALFYSGMRVDELCGLTVSQIDYVNDGLFFRKVRCKGKKMRNIFVSNRAARAVEAYLNSIDRKEAQSRQRATIGGEIFMTWHGRRLSQGSVWQVLANIARAADVTINDRYHEQIAAAGERRVSIKVHPHGFRHERTHALLESGRLSESIIAQQVLGHSSTKYIARYGTQGEDEMATKIKAIDDELQADGRKRNRSDE